MPTVVLPTSPSPRASVIILAWRAAPYLLQCLRSVSWYAAQSTPYEVILYLNEPDDALRSLVEQQVRGAQVIVSRVNRGFGGGCNRAAAVARGEYLVFLNDDTEVEPGWLDALVATADAHPQAGAVGSRILFLDGTLQEAGSVIWSDGTTAPVGAGAPADAHAFTYLRTVDYASACSLLVRRSTWEAIGGFDQGYVLPARLGRKGSRVATPYWLLPMIPRSLPATWSGCLRVRRTGRRRMPALSGPTRCGSSHLSHGRASCGRRCSDRVSKSEARPHRLRRNRITSRH
jgi:glycosyltransferase involved in cell wall biosynthesis